MTLKIQLNCDLWKIKRPGFPKNGVQLVQMMFLFNWVEFFHPGRLTWNLEIIHLERKMMFQTFIIMFHVNLPGCRFHVLFALATWKRGQPKVYISAWHSRGKKRVYPIRKKKTAKMIRFLGYHEASSRISLSFGCFFFVGDF